jgi:ubiquitin-conjugating enzyme E2 J2
MILHHDLILTSYLSFFRLTGLVSFMLSDEMTTGSVTTSDADKRVYASRSHPWNLQQRRFREAFPEVSRHFLCAIKAMPPQT